MNKYVLFFAALISAPALISAECGERCKSDDLAKKVMRTAAETRSCSKCCSSCSKCSKCCTCKSPEMIDMDEAETKCNCGKPKPKAAEE